MTSPVPPLQPYCKDLVPLAYAFVQQHYWGLGLLRYWTRTQVACNHTPHSFTPPRVVCRSFRHASLTCSCPTLLWPCRGWQRPSWPRATAGGGRPRAAMPWSWPCCPPPACSPCTYRYCPPEVLLCAIPPPIPPCHPAVWPRATPGYAPPCPACVPCLGGSTSLTRRLPRGYWVPPARWCGPRWPPRPRGWPWP